LDTQDPSDPTGNARTNLEYDTFPEYSIQAGLHYKLRPVDINFYLNNRIYLHMMEANKNLNPDAEDLPPYHRMDLNISKVVADKSEIYLDIRNILNRKNRVSSVMGAKDGYLEPGISVMLRAGYKL
jgi:outer membrane receptor protein involved in Fe transport